jgi:RimJ/RimL family protein N-acetyltransferase
MDDGFLISELGPELHWHPAGIPGRTEMEGRYVRLEPLSMQRHTSPLYTAQSSGDDRLWLYMGNGPFTDEAGFREYIGKMAASHDPLAFAVVPTGGEPAGLVTYLRIEPTTGSIEIGHIWYGASIQRSPVTTEVVYLLAKHAFDDLGYRRLEWKCHNRNERSKRAALRFGFTSEGVFRNHMIVRGRNRDTAWFSITSEEWPAIRHAFEAWLDPANFDPAGRQLRSLEEIRSQ